MRIWTPSNRTDLEVTAIADRHYNRQTPGARQLAPPGRAIVLKHYGVEYGEVGNLETAKDVVDAFWITSYPFSQYVHRQWPKSWVCTAFRNESEILSSSMIVEAVRITRGYYRGLIPDDGFISFVSPKHVRKKRDWGRCFRKAGFIHVGETGKGLIALQLKPCDMPPPLQIPGYYHVPTR